MSLRLNELVRQRFGLPTETGKNVDENPTLCDILDRRSSRSFKSEPIPEDLLQTLLAAAFSAPSKSDLQQACVIRIEDRTKHRRIAELGPELSWIAGAPTFLVWCGDSRRIRRLAEWRGHSFANDHLDAFMNAAVDAGIAMQTFILAAESTGLGCCPVSQIRDHVQALSEELNLPRWVFPVAGLCVGWPDERANLSMRLPLSVTVHTDRFDDEAVFDQVNGYDRRREVADPTPAEKQRMVEYFGICSDYGWSENRTRQYARPAREDFGRYIRSQGFDLS